MEKAEIRKLDKLNKWMAKNNDQHPKENQVVEQVTKLAKASNSKTVHDYGKRAWILIQSNHNLINLLKQNNNNEKFSKMAENDTSAKRIQGLMIGFVKFVSGTVLKSK